MKLMRSGPAVAVLLVVLAGCGEDRGGSPTPASGPSSTQQPATSPPTGSVAPAPGAHVIPDDFPLLTGLPVDSPVEGPDHGPRGPSRALDLLIPDPCDHAVVVPPHRDLLRGGWSDVEDSRQRQLVTFANRAAAAAYAQDVVEAFRDCPEQEWDDHLGTRSVVVRSDLSPYAWAVSQVSTSDGHPMPGLTTWHVVRVDRHVLLASTSNEGGAGPAAEVARQRDVDAAALVEVVRAMGVLGNAAERP